MNKHFGRVKWFGGLNRKTNRENDFGFLESMGGEDIFLHRRGVYADSAPVEGEVLVYVLEERGGKASAGQALRLSESNVSVIDVFSALQTLSLVDRGSQAQPFLEPLLIDFSKRLELASGVELDQLRNQEVRNSAYELLMAFNDLSTSGYSRDEGEWTASFKRLVEPYGSKVWSEIPWSVVPPGLLASSEEVIASCLSGLSLADAKMLALKNVGGMSAALVFFLCIRGIFATREELGSQYQNLSNFLHGMFTGRTLTALPQYAKNAYEQELRPKGGYRSCPVLWEIIEPLLFKKYLFEKNERFFELYSASNALSTNLETFVIFNLLSLAHVGNSPSELIPVFKQRLWEELVSGRINLSTQSEQTIKLFPVCLTARKNDLSCEAVYWEKQKKYLCRGKVCLNPQVFPDLAKHYLEFNVYDWLAHYGIDYAQETKPSNKDFAIKLAGYFNRLREIWPVLHCRTCAKIMVPNLAFSRTQYKDIEDGKIIVKEMAAAYRVTVFHCNDEACGAYMTGYYISHCLGAGCLKIIDSRELKVQCDNGRYVCKGCGSCCDTHAKEKPVGICGGCGEGLQLFERLIKETYRNGMTQEKKIRTAKCENRCGFEIPPEELPRKFFLSACQPVYRQSEPVR